jgi:hypothetical protein
MEHLSSGLEHQEQQQVQWRRDKVQELCSKGYSQREISQLLQVDKYSNSESHFMYLDTKNRIHQQKRL